MVKDPLFFSQSHFQCRGSPVANGRQRVKRWNELDQDTSDFVTVSGFMMVKRTSDPIFMVLASQKSSLFLRSV